MLNKVDREADVSLWILSGRKGLCPHPAVLDDMFGEPMVFAKEKHTKLIQIQRGEKVLWMAYTKNGWPCVWHYLQVDTPLLLEFLRAHWDSFVDAGYHPSSWFLNDCPKCGANSFEACLNLASKKGKTNYRIHKERNGSGGKRVAACILPRFQLEHLLQSVV